MTLYKTDEELLDAMVGGEHRAIYTMQIRQLRALETIASAVKDGTIQMRDVDRAKVYSEHLGRKLVKDGKED